MKKVLLVVSVAVMAVLASCTKENLNNNAPSQEGFKVSILGEMGEFAATKSTAESCIRLKWENEDVVYAYGSNGSSIVALGSLTVAVESGNAYVALMSGTLTAAPSDGKLYLVHCPLLTAAPEISGGAVSISLASQPSTCVPFVAYATVTDVSETAQSNLKASFSFASSVIKANVYGIANSTTMLSATLSDVNTACKITFGETISVEGETAGTVSKTLGTSSSASGKADFYIAVPAIAASSSRSLIVKTDDAWFAKTGAVIKAHEENAYVNTICDMTEATYAYETYGNGICIKGTIWAPVNCGYDATHTYGLLYQWGRKVGSTYGSSWDSPSEHDAESNPQTVVSYTTTNPDDNKFYLGDATNKHDWYTNHNLPAWPMKSGDTGYLSGKIDNPCPSGWRVPTFDELTALSANNQSGWATNVNDQNGYYLNGTENCTSTTEGKKVFLPAAGFFDESGIIDLRGYSGWYWSSSVTEDPIYIEGSESMYFEGDESTFLGLFMYVYDYRSQGLSVRCVKE